jgi:4-amino-4-deoxy-L-arabinose transferase-like glycosyltransferase
MPIVFQLAQNALLDLFTTLFGVTAVLAVLSRERLDWRTALAAAVPLGLGVGVKEHFAYVAVGAAVALGIVALRPGSLMRAARLLALLGALSLLAAA